MPTRPDRTRRRAARAPRSSLVRALWVAIALGLIGLGALLLRWEIEGPDGGADVLGPPTVAQEPEADAAADAPSEELPAEVVDPAPPRPRLALVIDDLGHNLNGLTRRALALPGPVTFAVLPGLDRTARVLEEIHRAGKPAFLHLPMEPDPGAGYDAGEPQIRVGTEPNEIRAIVHACLDALPGVAGVNNHMGSRATASWPEMRAVMEVLAERDLPFLDSQTTPHSVAHLAATEFGVPNLRNDIFLDVDAEDPSLVLDRLDQLVAKARRRGWAIGIGHVNEPTVAALEVFLPRIEELGIELWGAHDLAQQRARMP